MNAPRSTTNRMTIFLHQQKNNPTEYVPGYAIKPGPFFGVVIMRSCSFKCSLKYAKKSFYRTANAVFAQKGRSASEKATLHLIKSVSQSSYMV